MDVSLSVGKKFSIILLWRAKLNNISILAAFNSHRIAAAKSRCPKKALNDALKVSEITFGCIHGGMTVKTECTGKCNPR